MSIEKEPRFAVSTATFLNETDPRQLLSILGATSPMEIKQTLEAAGILEEMGIELVHRLNTPQKLLRELFGKVFSIHTPIWWDLLTSARQGWMEDNRLTGPIKDLMATLLFFGTLKVEFPKVKQIADQNQTPIVVHPDGARRLAKTGYSPRQNLDPRQICIEPDSRRRNHDQPWVWNLDEILAFAEENYFSLAFDVSHTIIATNSLDLRTPFEKLNRSQRIKVIHLNAAIPDPDTGIPKIEEGGLPINATPNTLSAVRELYQSAQTIPGIVFVFEYFKQRGNTFNEKLDILSNSREALLKS